MTDTWMLVETTGNGEPVITFRKGRPASFASLNSCRREYFRGNGAAIGVLRSVIDAARSSGEPTTDRVTIDRESAPTTITGIPVVGPFGVVHAVQVWIAPEGVQPPAPRRVGAFEWHADTRLTHHGPTIEREILGIADAQDVRVSHEVFQYFTDFEREGDLGQFIIEISTEGAQDGDTFSSYLVVKRDDDPDARNRCFMTIRAVRDTVSGKLVARGVVHDVSDVQPGQQAGGFDRQTARLVANLDDREMGIGRIDFATGIITEWLRHPPGPLDLWLTHNEEFHSDDTPRIIEAQQALLLKGLDRVRYRARVRFGESPWIWAEFVLTPDMPGASGGGMITARPLEADEISAPDNDVVHHN
ncbi:GAF domain-containing protein [Gordonia soli]|uniref:Rv3651-like N-terminal domain-containing protein n=1 Tax=Gordonia soli NBRC 108243 TaxID=1223545 RepID=M0QLQ4_9ACTN|nr:GAF domain-containing protein [Gordonia soli]GAC69236.1 hypothetical protein GS4_23_00300 [Gordonia soli NBRC 108243]